MTRKPLLILLPIALTACSGGKTADAVAKVNNHYISKKSLEQQLGRVAFMPGKDFSTTDKKKELLAEVINQELIFQAALKEGVLEKSDSLRGAVAREYLRQKVGTERYEPTEDEIKNYWNEKRETLERVRASHILIKPEKLGDDASETAAKTKAEGLLKKIKAGGDFAKLATQFSQDDGSKTRGGELFFFDRSKMVPEFSQAAFTLEKVGDVSGVVKTQYGYHIIKLTAEQRGIEYFRHSMKWQIAQEHQKKKSDGLIAELRKKASVEMYDSVIASVSTPEKGAGMPPGHPGVMPPTGAAPGGMPPANKQ